MNLIAETWQPRQQDIFCQIALPTAGSLENISR